jgi:hypothetical protein
VFEVAITTTFLSWAIGSAASAEFERVGPRIAGTLSVLISFSKAGIAPSFTERSSSKISLIFAAPSIPEALISFIASSEPFFCCGP